MNFGRYGVIRELGRGGMATVYLARYPSLDREVAVKVLHAAVRPDLLRQGSNGGARHRPARNEAVVQVYDFGEEDGQPYLVLEYMPGGSSRTA